MKLVRLVGILAVTFCLSVSGILNANAQQSGYLYLTVDCLKQNGDGTYTATFGYENVYRDNGYLVIVASLGDKNKFSPGDINRGQPTQFKYGKHPGAFSVTWDGVAPLTWEVSYKLGDVDYGWAVTADTQDSEQFACHMIPYADCIMRNYGRRTNGNWYEYFDAYFSYFNPGETKEIALGAKNAVGHYCYYEGCSQDLSQNQPTTFLPGHHRGAFSVSSLREGEYGNTSDFYWYISDEASQYQAVANARWSYTRECDLFPQRDCLQMGCQVPGQKGTKTAWFGYKNDEPFQIHQEVRNYYNSLRQAYGCEYNGYSGYDQFGRECIYPQPTTFEPGTYPRVFGICFSGNWNGGEDGGNAEDIPIEDAGLNNYGRVYWQLGTGWYDYSDRHYSTITSQSRQCNRAPTCSITPYSVPCAGDVTNLFLQSNQTVDPDGDNLSYAWSHNCKNGSLYGATTSNPVLGISGSENCNVSLTVKEQGTADGFSATCSAPVGVGACTLKANGCRNRDMNPTEYMLADACNAQEKLVERGVAFLRRIQGDGFHLRRAVRMANASATECRKHAWSFPDIVTECNASASCASQSLSVNSSNFNSASVQLDTLTRGLVKKILRAGQKSWGARYDKSRKALRENVQRLVNSAPKSSSTCS